MFEKFMQKKLTLPTAETALPGRSEKMPVLGQHFVLNTPTIAAWPENMEMAMFGMGCFGGPSANSGRAQMFFHPSWICGRLNPKPDL